MDIDQLIDIPAATNLVNMQGALIDAIIAQCTSDNDLLALSCIMLERAKEIMDSQLTEAGRQLIFQEYT